MLDIGVLAGNIRKYRKAKGLTQNQLAQQIRISPQSISKWECGASVPDIQNLCAISEALDISPDLLLGTLSAQENAMIAVDGGGTKTEFLLFGQSGEVLSRLILGGCNPNTVGIDAACGVLRQGIDSLLQLGHSISGIYIGAAGFGVGDNAAVIKSRLQRLYPRRPIECRGDIFNVAAGATDQERCIAVICGTGSIVYAVNHNALQRYSGWGYLLEPYGSGYCIGRAALCASLAQAEGFGEKSLLADLTVQKLGCPVWDAVRDIYTRPPAFIAEFAPLVFLAAAQGDRVAGNILRENADYLAGLINRAAASNPGMETVVLSGGVITKNPLFYQLIRENVRPQLHCVLSEVPQVYGAAILCCRLCSIDPIPIAGRLREQVLSRVQTKGVPPC